MATLTAITMHDSDDDEDEDYVPPDIKASNASGDERHTKRARTSSPERSETDKLVQKQCKERPLWQSFQASIASQSTSDATPAPVIRTVKIQKQHRYAGEIVTEVVEVPEDSDDAKKWPRCSETTPAYSSTAAPLQKLTPRPRKGKLSLNDLPDASFRTKVNLKPKKLTTLDMSAMQWRQHVSTSEPYLKHELDASRRAGGYLEKTEFLERVGRRREDALHANRNGKRRRL
ncbi:hypothetical protein CPB85DRAFT_1336385 [Mucidula mucida]|nr:hypothetical protein CPB85DRAFT_1336385 [Mucidula mucida]